MYIYSIYIQSDSISSIQHPADNWPKIKIHIIYNFIPGSGRDRERAESNNKLLRFGEVEYPSVQKTTAHLQPSVEGGEER